MESVKPTQLLPKGYIPAGKFDLNDNRGLAMILNLVGIGLLFGVGWLLLRSLSFLRPEYLSTENILVITGMREFWRNILVLVVSLGLMIGLNEGMRGLLFWMVIQQRPKLGLKGLYTFAFALDWYLPRRTYLFIRLTPILIVTLLGLVAVPMVPLNLVPGVLLLVSLNIAGAISDLVTTYWLLGKPKGLLVLDHGDEVRIFLPREKTFLEGQDG